MKKTTRILPEHIPDGQRFNEASLAELNEALHRFAGKGIIGVMVVPVGMIVCAVGAAKMIGGAAGFGLAAVLMMFMPTVMGLVMKFMAKEYTEAALKAGMTKKQLTEAIRNRNHSVAAWGVLPEINVPASKEEKKAIRRLRRKKILMVVSCLAAVMVIGLLGYDYYLTTTSNRSEFELSVKEGSISKAESKQMITVLDRRFKRLKEINHSKMKKPSYTLKNGKLICHNNSNILTDANCEYFFLQGDLSLVDDEGKRIVTEADFEKVDYVKENQDKPGTLFVTLTEEAFETLKQSGGSVRIQTGEKVLDKLSALNSNYISAEWLAEHAKGTTCIFESVNAMVYIAYLEKLPVELEVKK